MKIADIVSVLEQLAAPSLQESYDNAGLITGHPNMDCTGVLCTLDATEQVIEEARQLHCNMVVAHHPILFRPLKKITGKTYVERTIIKAIKHDVAIYAIHTNLDNVIEGVNDKIADKLNLVNRRVLSAKEKMLMKLYTFVPSAHAEKVRSAIFEAGAGQIGNYSECSFNTDGKGTFKAGENTDPYVGEKGKRHEEDEVKMEMILPAHIKQQVVNALIKSHPYEEVAYDVIALENEFDKTGSGLVGELQNEVGEEQFLFALKNAFNLHVIRHTPLLNKPVKTIALCGGAGSFLIDKACAAGANFYVTADVKYHEFFDADNRMVIADIGHWESEQFTIDLLHDFLQAKFPTFAVLKTGIKTNPVHYFT